MDDCSAGIIRDRGCAQFYLATLSLVGINQKFYEAGATSQAYWQNSGSIGVKSAGMPDATFPAEALYQSDDSVRGLATRLVDIKYCIHGVIPV